MSWGWGRVLEKVGLQLRAEQPKDGSRQKGGEARAGRGVRLLSPSSLQGQPGPPPSGPLLPGASHLLFLQPEALISYFTGRAHPSGLSQMGSAFLSLPGASSPGSSSLLYAPMESQTPPAIPHNISSTTQWLPVFSAVHPTRAGTPPHSCQLPAAQLGTCYREGLRPDGGMSGRALSYAWCWWVRGGRERWNQEGQRARRTSGDSTLCRRAGECGRALVVMSPWAGYKWKGVGRWER